MEVWIFVIAGVVIGLFWIGEKSRKLKEEDTSRHNTVKTTSDWWFTPTLGRKGRRGRRGNQLILSIVGVLVSGFAAVGWIFVSRGIFGIALGVLAAGWAIALLVRTARLVGGASGNPIYLGKKPEEESDPMDGYF